MRVLTLLLATFFMFVSCVYANAGYQDIEVNGETYKVLREDSSTGASYRVELPNGKYYYWKQNGNVGAGGGSPDLTREEMQLAEKAIEQYNLQFAPPVTESRSSSEGFFGLVFIFFGAIAATAPRISWYLQIGWKLRDAQPSKLALIYNRIIGVVFCIVGLFIVL